MLEGVDDGKGDWVPVRCEGSSGTDGGTLVLARSSPRRTRGGLELRRELERATEEVFGRFSLPGSPRLPVVEAALEFGL